MVLNTCQWYVRGSHQGCSVRKGVLRSFTKFTRKYLSQSLFFHKVAACNCIKKETLAQVFPVNYSKFLRTPFYRAHNKNLWATASDK